MTEELKECQLCHKSFPKYNFYKRKDRNGEYNWKTSYCKSCEIKKERKQEKIIQNIIENIKNNILINIITKIKIK